MIYVILSLQVQQYAKVYSTKLFRALSADIGFEIARQCPAIRDKKCTENRANESH